MRLLILAVLALALPASAGAQFWETKDYKTWTADECKKMLEDSPWAKKYNAFMSNNYRIDYVAQIRSALPVRQAVVRMAQIANKYDRMSDAQKKVFDASADAYLERQYDDTILVHVEYSTNDETLDRQMAAYWQSYPATPNTDVYLTGATNRRIAAMKFVPEKGAGRGFEFSFPRKFDGGSPVLHDAKLLRLEFQHPHLRWEGQRTIGGPIAMPGVPAQRIFVEFAVSRMTYRGQPAV